MAEESHPAEAGSSQASPAPAAPVKEGATSNGKNKKAGSRPVYEVGFHIVPTVEESQVGEVVEKIRNELAKGDTEIISEQFPAKMPLAYVIERSVSGKREKYGEAYFGWIKFAIEREHVAVLAEHLRVSKEILRSLIVETVREDAPMRRAVFTSDRLEGETIQKPTAAPEKKGEVSEEELDKSIEALVS